MYNLFGVSNHSGTAYFGHYIAQCKHPFTHQWFQFNDSSVHKIQDPRRVVSADAYVLFYERVKWELVIFSFQNLQNTSEPFSPLFPFIVDRNEFSKSNRCFKTALNRKFLRLELWNFFQSKSFLFFSLRWKIKIRSSEWKSINFFLLALLKTILFFRNLF